MYIAAGTPEFEWLRAGRFTAVLMWKDRAIASYAVDTSEVKGEMEFAKQWERAANHSPVLPDPNAAYWETTWALRSVLESRFTAADHLSIGWVRSYSQLARSVEAFITDETKGASFPSPTDEESDVGPGLRRFVAGLRDGSATPAQLLNAARSVHADGDLALLDMLMSHGSYLQICHRAASPDQHRHCLFYRQALNLYFCSSESTRSGQRIPWLDLSTTEFKVSYMELRPEEFSQNCPPQDYWARVHNSHSIGLGRLVSGTDFPVDLRPDSPAWDLFPAATDPDESDAAAQALVEEAVAAKAACIPNGAVLQLQVGPFDYVQLWESEKGVAFVWRTARGEFATALIDMPERKLVFDALEQANPDKQAAIRAGVFLLLAAVVRDFYVVEERERVFRAREARRPPVGLRRDDGAPLIVYLPRVRYRDAADIERCSKELDHGLRRTHFVNAHLRRSQSATDHQLILANRYGISVPKGYTFVRPHQRGDQARAVVYRSRSALRSLYTAEIDSAAGVQVQWFQFERDVQSMMSSLGFAVEHVAAARSGDDGVDVYARKGTDLEEVSWLIQCKCYSTDRKVGPATVRELLGALEDHPAGVRGMIVTTSRFSSGARELADQHRIRLMDGEEFGRRLAESRSN